MIVDGVLVAAEDCEVIGKALLVAQQALRKDGVNSATVAKYTEQALSVARERRKVASADTVRASSPLVSSTTGRWVTVSEAAAAVGRRGRTVQWWASSGAVPARKVGPIWTVDLDEVIKYARSRGQGRGDRPGASGREAGGIIGDVGPGRADGRRAVARDGQAARTGTAGTAAAAGRARAPASNGVAGAAVR